MGGQFPYSSTKIDGCPEQGICTGNKKRSIIIEPTRKRSYGDFKVALPLPACLYVNSLIHRIVWFWTTDCRLLVQRFNLKSGRVISPFWQRRGVWSTAAL